MVLLRPVPLILNLVLRKLSILGYETAFSFISSELNNFPLGVGTGFKGYSNLDLITPNRLLIGRNNRRAPRGYITFPTPGKILEQHEEIRQAWWNVWKTTIGKHKANFLPTPLHLLFTDIHVFTRDH